MLTKFNRAVEGEPLIAAVRQLEDTFSIVHTNLRPLGLACRFWGRNFSSVDQDLCYGSLLNDTVFAFESGFRHAVNQMFSLLGYCYYYYYYYLFTYSLTYLVNY